MICALGPRFRTAETIFLSASTAPPAASPSLVRSWARERYRTDKAKEWQVTVATVEAVKEASFLMTVQRVVGGVQVDDDFGALFGQAAQAHAQKGILDCLMVGADFMATGIFIVAKFKSVPCRSAGQCLALILCSAPASKRILFTDRHGKERIEPQKVMIVQILITCGKAQQTLGEQFTHRVFGKERSRRRCF
jgi:hypothetical protein